MYAPDNWGAWISDGLAHANFCMALWLCALGFRARRLGNRKLEWGIAAACAFNCALVVVHYLIWRRQMGL